jgi:hypothetical protein
MDLPQPGTNHCFISHSYRDGASLDACLKQPLPHNWTPFVFPPLTVTPDQAVSHHLLDALTNCDGFVYLDSPVSLGSFWVGFERNMAARLGKPVYAFRHSWLSPDFKPDQRSATDPIISVLFNLCIRADIERIAEIRDLIWDRYRFEIRGDKWRHLDNDARQMFDSREGLQSKQANGGIALVFLSNASICDGYHDYADPFTYRRAIKDSETPTGYTAEKFAALDQNRTLVIWLDPPGAVQIESALQRFPTDTWAPYVSLIRSSLADPNKLVVTQPDGRFDLNHLDTMLARSFWTALQADPKLMAGFRSSLTKPK